jgi:O-6-methylguanine DNA methyltransferase
MIRQDLTKLQQLLLKIPSRKVTTYGLVARAMDIPKKSRYVGYLLGSNPLPNKYPCYKVVKSDGSIGGYSGPGGMREKIRRLRRDGININRGQVQNFKERVFDNF